MKHIYWVFFSFACTKAEPDPYSKTCETSLTCLADDGASDCLDCDTTCTESFKATGDSPHVEGEIDYESYPPTGGPHNPCWWDWGVWDEAVPEERWVHNLEHGGVVFLYNCPEGCDAEIAALVEAVDGFQQFIISPNSRMTSRFAAAAWDFKTETECLDISFMLDFYKRHVGNGPEDVASMAPSGCMDEDTGGTD
jgi:hypothetical protein